VRTANGVSDSRLRPSKGVCEVRQGISAQRLHPPPVSSPMSKNEGGANQRIRGALTLPSPRSGRGIKPSEARQSKMRNANE
jgi:hypothetical protein